MIDESSLRKIVGWREWVSLPFIGIWAIKGKIDTGAKSSCLHAYDISIEKIEKKSYVNFKVHPIQGEEHLWINCRARLLEKRIVSDSGGHKEERYVIRTTLIMGGVRKKVDVTLSDRSSMKHRFLIGRSSLEPYFIDSSKSYLCGKTKKQKRFLKEIKRQHDLALEREKPRGFIATEPALAPLASGRPPQSSPQE